MHSRIMVDFVDIADKVIVTRIDNVSEISEYGGFVWCVRFEDGGLVLVNPMTAQSILQQLSDADFDMDDSDAD